MFKKILLKLLLLIFLLILLFPLTYFFARVYKFFVSHPVSNFFWGPDPYIFAGFLMALFLLMGLFLTVSCKTLLAFVYLIILNVLIVWFFSGTWLEDLILLSLSLWFGFIIGWILKKIFNHSQSTRSN
jgi:hypothetical protein